MGGEAAGDRRPEGAPASAAPGWVRAAAPASVSNVGCGFDVFGFALEGPVDEVAARRREEPGVGLIEVAGAEGLPRQPERNTATVAARALLDAAYPDGGAPGVELKIVKGVPVAGGLGSSAASAVAAVVALEALLGLGGDRDRLYQAALAGESVASGGVHGDNVAPSLCGGFVLVRYGEGPAVVPLPVPAGLSCAVLHPRLAVETGASRVLLGDRVALHAAVRQWSNTASLVAGLFRGDLELLGFALEDAVAEPLRTPGIPGFAAVKAAALAAGAVGCGLSGSGPSIFALARDRSVAARVLAAMEDAFAATGVPADGLVSAVGAAGARRLAPGELACAT